MTLLPRRRKGSGRKIRKPSGNSSLGQQDILKSPEHFIFDPGVSPKSEPASPVKPCPSPVKNVKVGTTSCTGYYELYRVLQVVQGTTSCTGYYKLYRVGTTSCTGYYKLYRVGTTSCTGYYKLYRVLRVVQGTTSCTGYYELYRVLRVVQGTTSCTGYYKLYRVLQVVQGTTSCTGYYELYDGCNVWRYILKLAGNISNLIVTACLV